MSDNGEAALSREVAACEAEEIERTDLAREAFRAKLAYWREHGAPGYLGPRATRDA